MAKKKVILAESSPIAKKPVVKKAPTADSSRKKQLRLLTHIEIGHVAGQVWALLVKQDNQSLASIKKAIGAPDMLVMAAIGWLAREDKLKFESVGRTTKISLR